MRHEDAVTIAGIISDVITSRRGASLFPHGKDADPSNLGSIWVSQIESIDESDADLATQAAIELFTSTVDVPTPFDFHAVVRKLRRDRRMATPALPEADFRREIPAWVKGKLLALSRDDTRVWIEQKPGYDAAQREYPYSRTYVWSEQEPMPDDERERYLRDSTNLTSKDLSRIFGAVTGASAPIRPRRDFA